MTLTSGDTMEDKLSDMLDSISANKVREILSQPNEGVNGKLCFNGIVVWYGKITPSMQREIQSTLQGDGLNVSVSVLRR